MLEADQFAEQSIVTTVGTRAFRGEESIEFQLGAVIAGSGCCHQAGPAQAGPGDADQTGWNGVTVAMEIMQSFENPLRPGQSHEKI
jgi:hypothetical protein